MTTSTAPVLDAYRTSEGQLAVWCEHERRWHWHGGCSGATTGCKRTIYGGPPCTCPPGSADGHRCAHCSCQEAPHQDRGYVLREVGPLTPAVKRTHRATRSARCPAPEHRRRR